MKLTLPDFQLLELLSFLGTEDKLRIFLLDHLQQERCYYTHPFIIVALPLAFHVTNR